MEIQKALDQLGEIDRIIKADSEKPKQPGEYDRFMSLVHQKEGIIHAVQKEIGRKPHWTKDGYKLD